MGLRARIDNIGLAPAGEFVVEIEGVAVTVDGLAAGDSTSVWVSGYSQQPLAIADVTEVIVESMEE